MSDYGFFGPDTKAQYDKLMALFDRLAKCHEDLKSKDPRGLPWTDETKANYRAIWNVFARFCGAHDIDLDDLEIEDLGTFLMTLGLSVDDDSTCITSKGEEITERYARRNLMLIRELTLFDARERNIAVNPVVFDMMNKSKFRYANASKNDPCTEHLNPPQAKRVIAYVTSVLQAEKAAGPMHWKELRDRTAVALMLGAGLKRGDVMSLTIDRVHIDGGRKKGVPWKLTCIGDGNSPGRDTPISTWAGRLLRFWLTVRQEQGIAGDLVLPSTLSGKKWAKTQFSDCCNEVLDKAGVAKGGLGLMRLRHTWALMLLAKGVDPKEVQKWLGLADDNYSMRHYQNICFTMPEQF